MEIQWATPEPANGIVTVYRVQYRYDDVDEMEEINGTLRNPYFVISDVKENTVYYFQVSLLGFICKITSFLKFMVCH